MSTFKTPPPLKGKTKTKTQLEDKTKTRSQTMDDFKHVLHIIDIEPNSELERALQTAMITSVRHLLRMTDEVLDTLEFKKGGKKLPVPIRLQAYASSSNIANTKQEQRILF
jgi:hypothetical protein